MALAGRLPTTPFAAQKNVTRFALPNTVINCAERITFLGGGVFLFSATGICGCDDGGGLGGGLWDNGEETLCIRRKVA